MLVIWVNANCQHPATRYLYHVLLRNLHTVSAIHSQYYAKVDKLTINICSTRTNVLTKQYVTSVTSEPIRREMAFDSVHKNPLVDDDDFLVIASASGQSCFSSYHQTPRSSSSVVANSYFTPFEFHFFRVRRVVTKWLCERIFNEHIQPLECGKGRPLVFHMAFSSVFQHIF